MPALPTPTPPASAKSALAAERTRIAKVLHDGISQTLTAAQFVAQRFARAAARASPKGGDALESDLAGAIATAVRELHALLEELRADDESASVEKSRGRDPADKTLSSDTRPGRKAEASPSRFSEMSSDPIHSSIPPPSRLFLLDDHRLLRQGLAALLESEPGLEICGEAEDAATALDQIASLKPDVLVTDISLPGMNGLEFLKHIKARMPGLAVVVLSMHDESVYAERALRAGAFAYVMKKDGADEVITAIRKALEGEYYVSNRVTGAIFNRVLGHARSGRPAAAPPVSVLTDRELEVFELLGRGKGTRDIADRLSLSPKTVESHRAHIKDKLELGTNAEMLRHATLWVEHECAGEN